jgi:hypothetical protein
VTDSIPQVDLGINDAAQSVVIVEGAAQVSDLAELISAAPGLLHPAAALTLARAANHFAQGSDYRVVEDPAAFEAAYRAKVDSEDPNAAWQEGVLRLRDHGMPDFSQIQPPVLQGTILTYFATDSSLGLPYRVVLDLANPNGKFPYSAVALIPFPPAAAPAAPASNPLFVGSNEPLNPLGDDGGLELAEPPLVIEDLGADDEPDEP